MPFAHSALALFVFAGGIVHDGSRMPAGSRPAVPKGLSPSDWSSLRAAYDANRYAPVAVDGGHLARNPGQQWLTRFDGRGFTTTPDAGGWSWGLELVDYGFAGQARAVSETAKVKISDARVSYEWDSTLTEWFVNDTRGLEHGYTVQSRPANANGLLTFTLAVRGDLRAEVQANGRDVRFVTAADASVLTYSGLTVSDADGKTLPARFKSTGDGLQLAVDECGARYPLTIDPIAQQGYLKASNTAAADRFGISAAVSGDTVAIGAYLEDSNATGVNGDQTNNAAPSSGAVYVFVRNGTTWSQQAYLKASNTDSSDNFGWMVSMSGDTLVVGAYQEDSNATGVNGDQNNNSALGSGAAYVFVRSGTTWSQQAYLKASNTEANDNFGVSVSVSGDTVVVGAFSEDSNATGVNGNQVNNTAGSSGAAYVFVRNGTTWSQQAYLKASNTEANDTFGWMVAVSGETVVVSATAEDSNATGVNGSQANNSASDSGAAYVFVRNGTVWSQQAYLKAFNTGAGDTFGRAIAVSGDTAVITAYQEDSNATGVNGDQSNNSALDSGAAYVFVRNGVSWSQQAYLKASNTEVGDFFGGAVSVSSNIIVVSTFNEASDATGVNGSQSNNNAPGSGAAYVYVRSGTSWAQQAYLKASNTEANDNFGIAVSVSGATVVVTAMTESSNAVGVNGDQSNNSASGAGAAYVFELDNNPGTSSYGTGTAGCAGMQTLDVNHAPMINSPHFAITCDNAPPSSLGLGIVADAQDLTGSDPFGLGVLLHVDFFTATEVLSFDFVSDASGNGLTVNTAIPNNVVLISKTYYAMALWAWSSCSLPPFNLSTSRGLAITILVP